LKEDIPRNITHVKVDLTVKSISEEAFKGCEQLMKVELNKGLERIDNQAFSRLHMAYKHSLPIDRQ
jgi:hypothetical protein